MLQNATELSFAITRRAHGVVLHEIEKGKTDWKQLDQIVNTWARNFQRVTSNSSTKKTTDFGHKTFYDHQKLGVIN